MIDIPLRMLIPQWVAIAGGIFAAYFLYRAIRMRICPKAIFPIVIIVLAVLYLVQFSKKSAALDSQYELGEQERIVLCVESAKATIYVPAYATTFDLRCARNGERLHLSALNGKDRNRYNPILTTEVVPDYFNPPVDCGPGSVPPHGWPQNGRTFPCEQVGMTAEGEQIWMNLDLSLVAYFFVRRGDTLLYVDVNTYDRGPELDQEIADVTTLFDSLTIRSREETVVAVCQNTWATLDERGRKDALRSGYDIPCER